MRRAPIRLYELVVGDGCPMSPFVWRVKYALAHKGLAFETAPVGFTEIQTVLAGRSNTVPAIEDGEATVSDSWAIVDYLDEAYPERPLFSSPEARALCGLFDGWYALNVLKALFRIYVKDIHDCARPEDRAYFRETREARLKGLTLEAAVADREDRLPALRETLAPLRMALASRPWLSGEAPGHADYIGLSGFLWVAGVSTLPLLAADDPLLDWVGRGFDLYGGLGRDPRQRPLAA